MKQKHTSSGGGGSESAKHQQILTATGKIDAMLSQLSDTDRDKFIADHADFFKGFGWTYYQTWRKTRARSIADRLNTYGLLNVRLGINDTIGETFYAGIPVCTADEVNELTIGGFQTIGGNVIENQKIGIDGMLHPCDNNGDFPDMINPDDIYGDGTMVNKQELEWEIKDMRTTKHCGCTGSHTKACDKFHADAQKAITRENRKLKSRKK